MSAHTAQTKLKLIGKLILAGEIHCETGLHIGAGKVARNGGADNPVVKDAFGLPTFRAVRCAASCGHCWRIRGRDRPADLVYLSKRRGQEVRIHQSDARMTRSACCSAAIRGARSASRRGDGERGQPGPADGLRFAARSDSITAQMRENLDDEITEVKSENAIDRITSQANAWTLERVPAGAGSTSGWCRHSLRRR